MASLITIIFFILAIVIYFLPTLVAADNKHHNTAAIFTLNLLFAWTFIGWGIAMIWAVSKPANGA